MKRLNEFSFHTSKMLFFVLIIILLTQCKDDSSLMPNEYTGTTENLTISIAQAQKIADIALSENQYPVSNARIGADTTNNRVVTDSKTFKNKKNGNAVFHVINYHKIDKKTNKKATAGFVIVSADRRIVPILASSETNRFDIDSISQGVDIWVEMASNELIRAKEKLKVPKPDVEYLWKDYESKPKNGRVAAPYPTCPSGIYTNTGIIIGTTWNQDITYNLYTPSNGCSSCGRASTGCGPTAIAQVWNYYQKPVYYYGSGGPVYYNYPLPSSRTGQYCDQSTAPIKDKHMAVLLKEAGTGASTNYNYANSCSALTWRENIKQAFVYANYSNSGQRGGLINNLTSVNSELLNSKPVIIDGNTSFNLTNWHIWIIDGYESYIWYTPNYSNPYICDLNSYAKYHLNWGWGGYSDGWYVLNNFQGGNDIYNYALNVTFGMRP